MILSSDALFTYIDCPLKYALKYNAKAVPEGVSANEAFSKTIHSVIYHFWYKIMNEGKASDLDLKNKWESMWFESNGITKDDIIYGRKRDKTDLGYKGLGYLQAFFRQVKYNTGVPICIDKEFMAPIGDHYVTGNLELVREVGNGAGKIIEIIDYKTGRSLPDEKLVERDLALTLQSYAFRHMFQAKEQKLTYFYLRHARPLETMRGPSHYRRLTETVNSVAKCIEDQIFYPRQTYTCIGCGYKKYCDIWPL